MLEWVTEESTIDVSCKQELVLKKLNFDPTKTTQLSYIQHCIVKRLYIQTEPFGRSIFQLRVGPVCDLVCLKSDKGAVGVKSNFYKAFNRFA